MNAGELPQGEPVDQAATITEALLAPLRAVGELLAIETDRTNARCAVLELEIAELKHRVEVLRRAAGVS